MVVIFILSLSTRTQSFRLGNNLSGQYKRGTGMAMLVGFGNFSGVMAISFYRSQDSPRFILGREACLSMSVLEPHGRFLRQMLLN